MQRGAPAHQSASTGWRQNMAASARISNCWASDMRGSGGISKPRNSIRPRRPVGPSGLKNLSMQISVRWVLPVTSTRLLRSRRSVTHASGWG
jgi:hypothetical protein